jgi:hypothetical protein
LSWHSLASLVSLIDYQLATSNSTGEGHHSAAAWEIPAVTVAQRNRQLRITTAAGFDQCDGSLGVGSDWSRASVCAIECEQGVVQRTSHL